MHPWLTPFYYDLQVSDTQQQQKNIKTCFDEPKYFKNKQSCLTTACLTQIFDNPKNPYAVDVRSEYGKIGRLDDLTAIRFRNWRQCELKPYYVPCHIYKEKDGVFSVWLDADLSAVSGSVADLQALMASPIYQNAKEKYLQSQQQQKTTNHITKLLMWLMLLLVILGVMFIIYLALPELTKLA